MKCRVGSISIDYIEVGAGRPLVMLHGGGLDHRHMLQDMEPLFEKRVGWRRIYPDLPGMGKTKAADWIKNQDDMLEIVVGFIEAVAPGQRFTVAGASYGSYLARGVVWRRKALIDGLLLIVPVIEPDKEKCNLPKHQVLNTDQDFLAALAPNEGWMRDLLVVQSMDTLQYQRGFILPALASADREFMDRMEANNRYTFDVDAPSTPLQAPTLFLMGKFDPWCGYREAYRLLDQYPRATFAVLDRAGHALSCEQKGLFQALVGEWLDRVEEYSMTGKAE